MDFEKARFNMVEQQIRPWNVVDQQVLDLFMTIPREQFVLEQFKQLAFAETELPLLNGQFMLKPLVEGKILQALQIKPEETVLEIGTGSGFFTALLASLAKQVDSYEIDKQIFEFAKNNLMKHDIKNINLYHLDGLDFCQTDGTYDVIVLTGSLVSLPFSLKKLLKKNGRLFAILGQFPVMKAQLIRCIEQEVDYQTEDLFETSIPMLTFAEKTETFQF